MVVLGIYLFIYSLRLVEGRVPCAIAVMTKQIASEES